MDSFLLKITKLKLKNSDRLRDAFVEGVRSQLPVGSNSDPTLQEYIRKRMWEHCDMVDKFGLGTYQEVLGDVEKTMCEVWVGIIRGIRGTTRLAG